MKNISTCIISTLLALSLVACDDHNRAAERKLSAFTGFNTEILGMQTLNGTTLYTVKWQKYDNTSCHAVVEEYGERYSYTAQPKCK